MGGIETRLSRVSFCSLSFFFLFFVECPVEKNTWKFRIFESFILNLL